MKPTKPTGPGPVLPGKRPGIEHFCFRQKCFDLLTVCRPQNFHLGKFLGDQALMGRIQSPDLEP